MVIMILLNVFANLIILLPVSFQILLLRFKLCKEIIFNISRKISGSAHPSSVSSMDCDTPELRVVDRVFADDGLGGIHGSVRKVFTHVVMQWVPT